MTTSDVYAVMYAFLSIHQLLSATVIINVIIVSHNYYFLCVLEAGLIIQISMSKLEKSTVVRLLRSHALALVNDLAIAEHQFCQL